MRVLVNYNLEMAENKFCYLHLHYDYLWHGIEIVISRSRGLAQDSVEAENIKFATYASFMIIYDALIIGTWETGLTTGNRELFVATIPIMVAQKQ